MFSSDIKEKLEECLVTRACSRSPEWAEMTNDNDTALLAHCSYWASITNCAAMESAFRAGWSIRSKKELSQTTELVAACTQSGVIRLPVQALMQRPAGAKTSTYRK
ncbi:hypothetical protein AWB81_07254 [Caballeronia arationis]|jgi:hypothetical protein|uniref:Uncharacterized protein n=1 Tax=Caballeronia arationis TaxID=1777142 RepID=A0A7Z7N7K2_9BURK|nr:hypothetical protein AWB81_07254 [Caballeronia arationis]SOE89083.1 hypothetical protein SAMN05446927_7737 [Caballeronia arationis]